MNRLRNVHARIPAFLRFLISGGINTAFTYAIYLILLHFINYQISYAISYVVGIATSFVLSKYFVFRSDRGAKSAILFPFVYLIQYLIGVFVLWVWVDLASLSKAAGPAIVVCVTIPVTFLLSRAIFTTTTSKK
jgi:putative flippase GtrA